MNKEIFKIVYMPNGLKMMSVEPINETGIAEAYITIKDNPMGCSKGYCGPLSSNIYKPLGREEGINDFMLCCESMGISYTDVITNRLIAFTDIVRDVDEKDLEGYDIFDEPSAPRADGLITESNKITLMNYAADCAIIMFLDKKYKIAGILHAAWKGSLLGIIEAEVEAFRKKTNNDIDNLIAVMMPSISLDCFEVGDDCAEQFVAAGYKDFVDFENYTKPHVDLAGVNKSILLKCGINPENIYSTNEYCTYKNADLFHSYRRGPVGENNIHYNGMNGYFIKLKPDSSIN